MTEYDAVVVGSGPNGLAAGITLARAGRSVVVLEANATLGGAARTEELTEPGFRHDIGSAIHPFARASPFFASLDLKRHGLRWIDPPAAVAHPLDDGDATIAWNNLDRTVDDLGPDGPAYRRLIEPWVDRFDDLLDLAFKPLVRVPRNPIFAARFGAIGVVPVATTARKRFDNAEAKALLAGHAGHAFLPLTAPFTTSVGLLFGASTHAAKWAFPEGGAQSLVDAMVAELIDAGGEVRTDAPVRQLSDLPEARATIFTVTPGRMDDIVGDTFPTRYRKRLQRFRIGPGAWKVDYALSEPIPWTNPQVAKAGTAHLGGTLDEVVEAEAAVAAGQIHERPFVLLAQHSLFDSTRAPKGKHTAWAYCHVPNGSTIDQTDTIDRQIERFAPGFLDTVIARSISSPAVLERQNTNLVGGDIGGGSYSGTQLLLRPGFQRSPYDTADERFFNGGASTTPGAGVHGMCGFGAAQRALSTVLR